MPENNQPKKHIFTCFSPLLYPLFRQENNIVVVVDIFRATSAICTALHHGVERIIPVASLEEARNYKKLGYLVAAERNAEKQEGFDFGNSPLSFLSAELKGKTIAISTTNGTQAIEAAKGTADITVGSFLNINALANHLLTEHKDVVILCSGWKNRFNLEDSLFAGALADLLLANGSFQTDCDSTIAASHLYKLGKNNLFDFLANSSHRKRLQKLQLDDDIRYCLQHNIMDTVPIYAEGFLVNLNRIEPLTADMVAANHEKLL